ncbi:MAG: hypothetical protein GX025_02925 [Clostridiales bacterium]|nr:hypothetical protein [Clostridiales bacterium]
MTREARIGLLKSKSQVYRSYYLKSVAKGDTEAAEKWKTGYYSIKEEVDKLQEG